MSFPRTLSAGIPKAVLSSTPGSASPIFRTVSKPIVFLGIGLEADQPHSANHVIAVRPSLFITPGINEQEKLHAPLNVPAIAILDSTRRSRFFRPFGRRTQHLRNSLRLHA